MSSLYADNSGPGSVAAAQMAVADFGGAVLGKKIEVVSGQTPNKADVGASITRQWIDRDCVDRGCAELCGGACCAGDHACQG